MAFVLAPALPGLADGGESGPTAVFAHMTAAAQSAPAGPSTYRVYVANESSDLVSRVAFTPGEGAVVEKEIPVGVMPGDNDGAHGLSVSPDGRFWYVTIAHGTPFGYAWKFAAGPDTLVARTELGLFPATMGLTPDGQFLFAANFNLHGDMVPSDVSVVYTPDMLEILRIRTCLMPHGSRLSADGGKQYSVCMHSDQLVEIDVETLEVSARFHLAPGRERRIGDEAERADHAANPGEGAHGRAPMPAHDPEGLHADALGAPAAPVCSPTWAEPGAGPTADRVVYVACNKNQEVLEVDTERWIVSRRLPTGKAPYNLEAVAGGSLLLATLKGEQGVAVFDLEAGEEVARLAASRPITHGVVATPDGRYAFVSNESAGSVRGTVDVIDLESLSVVASVELQHQPGGIDYWPGAGRTGDSSQPAQVSSRPVRATSQPVRATSQPPGASRQPAQASSQPPAGASPQPPKERP